MNQLIIQSILLLALFNNIIYCLPTINFTNSVLTNRMIEALNEALLAQDRQQLLTSLQTLQDKYQQPSYQQIFTENQHPTMPPSYQHEYSDFYPGQIFGTQGQQQQQQQQPHYQQSLLEQQPANNYYPGIYHEQQPANSYYPNPYPGQQQPQPALPSGSASNFHQQPFPENPQGSVFDNTILHKPGTSNYQPVPQLVYPAHIPDQQYPGAIHPQFVVPAEQHPQLPNFQQVQPVPLPNPSYASEIHQSANFHPSQQYQPPNTHLPSHLPDPSQQPIYSQHIPAGAPGPVSVHPGVAFPEHGQHVNPSAGDPHHPFQYQPVNWFDNVNPWSSNTGDAYDTKKPIQVIQSQPVVPLSGDCPAGFCPLGAVCSQNSGQWQCGCGQNACTGVENPCGIFGRYYFPYYPDATRFIQCDQTGVFWIRKCAPGTVFDPKISVCNYPPVMVELGKV